MDNEHNIFSWGKEFGKEKMLNQQEVEKLREGFQQSVLAAETARQQSRKPGDAADRQIQTLFECWASEERQRDFYSVLERMGGVDEKGGEKLNVEMVKEVVNLGLAGHFRIRQVHETNMAERNKWWWQLGERLERLKAADTVFQRWYYGVRDAVREIPYTIHGGPIDWELEIIQDRVAYWHSKGEDSEAARMAEQGSSLGLRKIDGWILENLPTDYQSITRDNIAEHLREVKGKVGDRPFNRLIGTLSAVATLEYRKGVYDKDIGFLTQALKDVSAIQEVIPNNHRFATINWRVLFACFAYKGCSIEERLNYVTQAARNLYNLGKKDPKAVIRSFLQML